MKPDPGTEIRFPVPGSFHTVEPITEGTEMSLAFCDIETRSRVNLPKSNVYRYTDDPDFRILMMAYAVDNGTVEITTDPREITELLYTWLEAGDTIVAHNAQFERIAFSAHLRDYPDPRTDHAFTELGYLNPEYFDDSAALATVYGYPAKLETVARWLGGQQKDEAGSALIRYFSIPNRKGEFNPPEADPVRWQQFMDYCRQDVETHRDVYQKLPAWPGNERDVWLTDQHINDTGIAVDEPLATAAVDASDTNRLSQELEISTLTGVMNPGSVQQMQAWFSSTGLDLPDLKAATVTEALSRDDLTADQRRVLELRQELALVASKKYIAALDRIDPDSRLRGSFQYFGAHTGRWAGRGVQLQNLPAATIEPGEGVDLDTAIQAEALDVTMGLGASAHSLKALVRSMFLGPFTVVDYSAIEARVLAWVAGESWAIEAFEAGRDIYVETAARMGNLSRKEGKVATLALGYNGGIGSLRAMGAEGNDAYLQRLVDQWRGANRNIVALWAKLGEAFWHGGRAGRVTVVKKGNIRQIQLPSGRAITYHGVRQVMQENRWGNLSPQLSFRDPKKGLNGRTDTYGGRVVENITQAIARDILADSLVELTRRGYKVVGHVHDELIVEGTHSIDEVSQIMCSSSPWSEGLPLDAEGYHCGRYRKG